MDKKEIKKRVKLEMAHQAFIADQHKVEVYVTPMALAFTSATKKGK